MTNTNLQLFKAFESYKSGLTYNFPDSQYGPLFEAATFLRLI